jgi:hypothetical protein
VTEENIRRLLACLGVSTGGPHGEWYRASCPLAFHRHRGGKDLNPSFGVHIDPKGRSGYLCYSCQIRSRDLADLLVDLSFALKTPAHPPPPMNLQLALEIISSEDMIGYSPTDWSAHVAEQEFEEFPLWWLDSFPSVFKFPEAAAYLNSRAVPTTLWSDLELRYDVSRKMVCFPYFNTGGRLAGMRGRAIMTSNYPHHEYSWNSYNNSKLVLYGENRIDWMKPVVIVEGEFDYCRVLQVYPNVVANLTATLSERKLVTLEMAVSIIGFWDSDEAGRTAAKRMEQRFGIVYSDVTYPPHPEEEKLDPGKLSLSLIGKMLEPHLV